MAGGNNWGPEVKTVPEGGIGSASESLEVRAKSLAELGPELSQS